MASASFHLLAFFIFSFFYQITQEDNPCCSEEVQIPETIPDFKCFSKHMWWRQGVEYQYFGTEFLWIAIVRNKVCLGHM